MKSYKKVVFSLMSAIGTVSVVSVIIFISSSTQNRLFMNHILIVMSGYTSLAALGVSLWTYWKYKTSVENPLEEMKGKTDTLVEDLNEGFLEELVDALIQAEERFANLPKKKQKKVIRMVEKYSDSFMQRIEEMPSRKPEKKIDKAESKED